MNISNEMNAKNELRTENGQWSFQVDGWDNPVYECSEQELGVDVISIEGENGNNNGTGRRCNFVGIPTLRSILRQRRRQRKRQYSIDKEMILQEMPYDHFSSVVSPTPIKKNYDVEPKKMFSFKKKDMQKTIFERRQKQQERRKRRQEQQQNRRVDKFKRLVDDNDNWEKTIRNKRTLMGNSSSSSSLSSTKINEHKINTPELMKVKETFDRKAIMDALIKKLDEEMSQQEEASKKLRRKKKFHIPTWLPKKLRRAKRHTPHHRRSNTTVIIDQQSNEIKVESSEHPEKHPEEKIQPPVNNGSSSCDYNIISIENIYDTYNYDESDLPMFIPLTIRHDGLCPFGCHEIVRPPIQFPGRCFVY